MATIEVENALGINIDAPYTSEGVVQRKEEGKVESLSLMSWMKKACGFEEDKKVSPRKPIRATPQFELTPLSTLIAQSFQDLQTLRKIHALAPALWGGSGNVLFRQNPLKVLGSLTGCSTPKLESTPPASTATNSAATLITNSPTPSTPSTPSSSSPSTPQQAVFSPAHSTFSSTTSVSSAGESLQAIDFTALETNLRRFQEFYEKWVESEGGEEVHLVAIVCKRGDVVRGVREGGIVKGKNVPVLVGEKEEVPDCGM